MKLVHVIRRILPISNRAWIWIAFNLLGVTYFLACASRLWGDVNIPSFGDAFYWLLYILPALLISLVVNILALGHLIASRGRALRLRAAVWASITCLWLIAVMVDGKMHGEPCQLDACIHGSNASSRQDLTLATVRSRVATMGLQSP
jgi:hypothetical protein